MYGTPTWRISRMCSRVCGIGPSVADDHEDRAVHLGGAGDHVLDVVGVTGAVDVRVVALRRLVLLVRDGDRDTALFFFGRVVDVVDVALLDVASSSVARQLMIAAVSVVLPWST